MLVLHLGVKAGSGTVARCGAQVRDFQFTSLEFAKKVAAGHRPPGTEVCQQCWQKAQEERHG